MNHLLEYLKVVTICIILKSGRFVTDGASLYCINEILASFNIQKDEIYFHSA